ncbi:hypothetical protein CT19431_160328 [Cupriavidus taiwanensis]|nr:hypothetical protein CT19431_160328 [Cupriavidus taiwanensis]
MLTCNFSSEITYFDICPLHMKLLHCASQLLREHRCFDNRENQMKTSFISTCSGLH